MRGLGSTIDFLVTPGGKELYKIACFSTRCVPAYPAPVPPGGDISLEKDSGKMRVFKALPARFLPLQLSKVCSFKEARALWLSEELRKGDKSKYFGYMLSLPTLEDYAFYHPAMARQAGLFQHQLCQKREKERALKTGKEPDPGQKCPEPWTPGGHAATMWDSKMTHLNQCVEGYLNLYNQGKMDCEKTEPGWEHVYGVEGSADYEQKAAFTLTEVSTAYMHIESRGFRDGQVPIVEFLNIGTETGR